MWGLCAKSYRKTFALWVRPISCLHAYQFELKQLLTYAYTRVSNTRTGLNNPTGGKFCKTQYWWESRGSLKL